MLSDDDLSSHHRPDGKTVPADDVVAMAMTLHEKLAARQVNVSSATPRDWYEAVTALLRDHLSGAWDRTQNLQRTGKRANYLSMEYLLGPHMQTAIDAAGIDRPLRIALEGLGQDAEAIIRFEPDPGLGNGGLGRLAACFLDSGANMHLPLMGYGLFYREGFFSQRLDAYGRQTEAPDPWLAHGAAWAIERRDVARSVKFFGNYYQEGTRHIWENPLEVKAYAIDMMVPAFDGRMINSLRLWQADLTGLAPVEDETYELLGRVNARLYPDDTTDFGRRLRLMQEFFFTSLSLQDIVARHLALHPTLENLPATASVQLNDTHPAIAIAELMRLLVDEHGLGWSQSKAIVRATCFYTNHTLMPEALEQWAEDLMRAVLPRHLGIIKGLHDGLMAEADAALEGKPGELQACRERIAVIRDGRVRMGHLAAFYSARTNGVSAMHSDLVAANLFPDLAKLRGKGTAINHTNGITPRRWLFQANPKLGTLITGAMGDEQWVMDLPRIDSRLDQAKHEPDFRAAFAAIKRENKTRLAELVARQGGPALSADALYDIQIKRFHEYKRQFMNLLHTVALYLDIVADPGRPRPNTVKLFAGKAAPSYFKAKDHLALVNWLADRVNHDVRVGDRLKVAFIEDYNVSKAQIIIPAADLSEQISTAGTEASGTSNMKFVLNGAVTIGTRDGANVEIGLYGGEENTFFFGCTEEEVETLRRNGYNPRHFIDARLQGALDYLINRTPFGHLARDVLDGDRWMIAADFASYWNVQERARALYMNDPEAWLTLAIDNVRTGTHFSSDNTIKGYGRMWGIEPAVCGDAA